MAQRDTCPFGSQVSFPELITWSHSTTKGAGKNSHLGLEAKLEILFGSSSSTQVYHKHQGGQYRFWDTLVFPHDPILSQNH